MSFMLNDKQRSYFVAMNSQEDFVNRLNEAIEYGAARQVRIAEFCGVSEQAVARWKRTGQISKENLLAFSEITGYRYLYLKNGELPKRIESNGSNREDYMVAENAAVYYAPNRDNIPPELEKLINALKLAHANKNLSTTSISVLTDFIKSLNERH